MQWKAQAGVNMHEWVVHKGDVYVSSVCISGHECFECECGWVRVGGCMKRGVWM